MTRKQRWVVFIVAGLFAVALAGMFGYIVWTTMKNVTAPPRATAEDRRLVITAEALAEYGGPAPNPAAESFTVMRQFDGSRHINYDYNTSRDPNAPADTRLNTTTMTMVHTSSLSAIQAYKMQEVTTKTAIKLGQGKGALVDTPNLITVGDAHYAGVFRNDNQSTGHLFVVRQGRFVFTVLIFGLVFEDAEDVNALFLPLVEEAKKRS